jgi:diguanylate cyclase (GGDEF)-like protein
VSEAPPFSPPDGPDDRNSIAWAMPERLDVLLIERFGVKKRDLTPSVRTAIVTLMAENRTLSREAAALQDQLSDAVQLADRDPLLPVLNRRAFLAELQRSASYVERYGATAAVLYIDLDGFKALNDENGHPAGDAALLHIALLLRDHVRDSDVVGRLGGDEFGVILVQAGREEAKRKAAALSALINATPLEYEGRQLRLGASIGVHSMASAENAEDALARADEAMYAVKHAAKRAVAPR